MLFPEQLPSDTRIAHARSIPTRSALGVGREPSGTLRIATYNIHKGVSALSRRNRIHDLRRSLHSLHADIVFLQEVQGRSERHARRFSNWPAAAQHDYLAASVWEHVVYGRNAVRADADHGNALLSRFALVSSENLDVSDHAFESRGLLHCELDVNGLIVHCLCAHFGLFEESRKRQAEALIARIRATVPDGAPLIIAGDFNDWRNRLGERLAAGLGVQEVFGDESRREEEIRAGESGRALGMRWMTRSPHPARTFPAVFPVLRLDRIYVRGLEIEAARVVHGPGWRRLSDHAPIVADLRIPDHVRTPV
jgi:endonuclease/exonuclease/phosphatase family metal-dependent hydrolase